MRPAEAQYVAQQIISLPLSKDAVVLDLGSSTHSFRTVSKPHIDRELFAPLRKRGLKVVHADLKEAEGVDIAGDIFDPAFRSRCKQLSPQLTLCCNILEHVPDREAFVAAVDDIVPLGGHLVVSVPYSYYYHPDPIDTMYRPPPEQIATLFGPSYKLLASTIISDGNWAKDLRLSRSRLGLATFVALETAKIALAALTGRRWLWRVQRYKWLVAPFKVSIVVLHKTEDRA